MRGIRARSVANLSTKQVNVSSILFILCTEYIKFFFDGQIAKIYGFLKPIIEIDERSDFVSSSCKSHDFDKRWKNTSYLINSMQQLPKGIAPIFPV